jgi:hypothetical protein
MFNQWAFRSICIAFDFRTLFVRHRGMNEWVEFLRPFDSFPSFLPSFLLSSTYIYLPCYTLGSIFPHLGTHSTIHPRPFVRSFRQQNFHLSLLQSLPALTSIHHATTSTTLNYATPKPSIAPCSFTTCPASEYEALQRNLTLLPAPRSTPCTRIVCVMPFCCDGARERPDCGSSLRV